MNAIKTLFALAATLSAFVGANTAALDHSLGEASDADDLSNAIVDLDLQLEPTGNIRKRKNRSRRLVNGITVVPNGGEVPSAGGRQFKVYISGFATAGIPLRWEGKWQLYWSQFGTNFVDIPNDRKISEETWAMRAPDRNLKSPPLHSHIQPTFTVTCDNAGKITAAGETSIDVYAWAGTTLPSPTTGSGWMQSHKYTIWCRTPTGTGGNATDTSVPVSSTSSTQSSGGTGETSSTTTTVPSSSASSTVVPLI